MLSKILIIREIKIIKHTIGDIFLSIISCLLITCIFLLILEEESINSVTFHGIILIITTLNILTNDYISNEFRLGIIEQLFLLPISPFKIILIKCSINASLYILLHIILWYLICLIFKIDFYYLQYILFAINLIVISFLIMTISISLQPKQHLFSNMLLLPIIFPQMIISILSVIDKSYIYLCLSLTIIMLPIFIIFSTFSLKNAIASSN